MSNDLPAILSDLVFNATDLQRPDYSVHLDIVGGLSDGVEVRGKDTVIPGLEGIVARSRVRGARHLQLVGPIQAVGATEALRLAAWQELLDELEMLFDPAEDPADLIGTALDGSTRSITCRVEQGGYVRIPSPVWGVETISVALIAYDPNWNVT